MGIDHPPRTEEPSERVVRTILERLSEGKFHFEPGETHADILQRTEIMRAVADVLPILAERFITGYREILNNAGIPVERTGALSCLLVGGNVHKESSLKSWSDFDLVIAAEKPFAPGRMTRLEHPSLSYSEIHVLGKALWDKFEKEYASILNEALERQLDRPANVLDMDAPEGGLIELKGYGSQSPTEVQDALLLYKEK